MPMLLWKIGSSSASGSTTWSNWREAPRRGLNASIRAQWKQAQKRQSRRSPYRCPSAGQWPSADLKIRMRCMLFLRFHILSHRSSRCILLPGTGSIGFWTTWQSYPSGMPGHAIYGPHLRLPEGRWRLEFLLNPGISQFSVPIGGRLPRSALTSIAPGRVVCEKQVDMGQLFGSALIFRARKDHSYEFRVFDHHNKRPEELVFISVKPNPVPA